MRWAKVVRRATALVGAAAIAWFFLRFGTEWVPRGMDTVPEVPPGAWCIVDRWNLGLKPGRFVFVETPAGTMLSRIESLDDASVTLWHPNAASSIPDSRSFGAVPRQKVLSTVVVALPPSGESGDGR